MADKDNGDKGEPRFADLIGAVRRLKHDGANLRPPPPAPRRRRISAEELPPDDSFGEYALTQNVPEFQRNGVQNSVFRKLRRGQFPIEDEVDLHGLNVTQAHALLSRFLGAVRGPRMSCVRVIHGKGFSSPDFKPVLKPRVRHWLREDTRVLAYAEAPHHDGGSGAVYVLIRSRTNV